MIDGMHVLSHHIISIYVSILMLQVLFRYAIAIFKYLEESVLRQSDYMSIFHTLRNGLEELKDIRKLTQVGTGNTSCSMMPRLVCTFSIISSHSQSKQRGGGEGCSSILAIST